MKKLLGLMMAGAILVTGCTASIDGEERDIVKIERQDLESTYGTVYDTDVDGEFRIVDLIDMDTEINEEGQGSYTVDSSVKEFDDLEPGDTIHFDYDDKTIHKITEIEKGEEPTETEEESEEITPEATVDLEDMVEISSTPLLGFDLDIERISVYSDAELANDEVLFDDGNRFLVVAHSDIGDYILMDDIIQIPTVNTSVYTIGEDLYVNILEEGTAHISYTSYKYVDGVFEVQDIYNQSENVNVIGSM